MRRVMMPFEDFTVGSPSFKRFGGGRFVGPFPLLQQPAFAATLGSREQGAGSSVSCQHRAISVIQSPSSVICAPYKRFGRVRCSSARWFTAGCPLRQPTVSQQHYLVVPWPSRSETWGPIHSEGINYECDYCSPQSYCRYWSIELSVSRRSRGI